MELWQGNWPENQPSIPQWNQEVRRIPHVAAFRNLSNQEYGMMSVSLSRITCSLALLLSSAGLVMAQQAAQPAQPRQGQIRAQPGQPGLPGQPGQPAQFGQQRPGRAGAQQLEPSIVTLLIIDNNKEIALGQLGQQKSQNERVKQFCEMIVKDHSKFVEDLQEQMAGGGRRPGLGAETGADRDRGAATAPPKPLSPTASTQPDAAQRDAAQPGRERTAQNRNQPDQATEATATAQEKDLGRQQAESGQGITVAKPVIGNQPGAELLQLCHEVAEACLDSARRDAERLGDKFDTHFMGAQIVAHKEMLDKLRVFQQHVSPQTKQLLAQAQKTTQQHLEEAQSIHESLSKQSGQGQEQNTKAKRSETRQERE
jgi:predicted outer membrane protein